MRGGGLENEAEDDTAGARILGRFLNNKRMFESETQP